MLAEFKVGPAVLTDGVTTQPRLDRQGNVNVGDAHARMYESVYRGAVFSATTGAGGVTPGTALSTTPAFQIYNPTGSGKNLVILRTAVGYVSGTLGGGSIVYSYWGPQVATPTTGTALTPVCNLIGNSATGVALARQGSTLSGTSLILRPAFTMGAWVAATAAINAPLIDEVAGEFIVAPGNVFCMQGVAAAGSSPVMTFAASWEEVLL